MKSKFYLILYYGFARHLPASHTPWGKLLHSQAIRYYCCKHIFKYIGHNVNIEKGAWFGKGQDIEIGDNSGIGLNAHIHNNTIIGRVVMMGPNCFMLESIHNHDRLDIPMLSQGTKKERDVVVIEDDVWIGQDVLIMSSRTIRKGSIIAARCVLTKDFPEYCIVGGNPSKLLKSRLPD